ncbi:MAG: Lrp/AsnC family transcriptional regulator [Desulfobacterales bacterium]|jgi:DNA-binding Lrp family transcriptional regulator|nr:Lrp/AsnC family transcriptional regulator [Desulfobacterales bacterium]
MLTDLEKKVIASIQQDLPITDRPYLDIARRIGVPEETLLAALRSLSDRGIIRRFGATLRHQRTGYKANAMGAWRVDESRIEEIGRTMASFRQVSHCYRRNPTSRWPYNLYTMIHAEDEAACRETARRMAKAAGVDDYALLFSREELKKTSMVYFATDDED